MPDNSSPAASDDGSGLIAEAPGSRKVWSAPKLTRLAAPDAEITVSNIGSDGILFS